MSTKFVEKYRKNNRSSLRFRRKAAFDGAAMRRTIHGPEVEERHHLVGHTQHKAVGGKKGRPVFVGRSLHSRGRVHFRPHAHCHLVPRVKVSEVSPTVNVGSNRLQNNDCRRILRTMSSLRMIAAMPRL